MGNCDFTKNQAENTGTINKNTFQQHYVVGRGIRKSIFIFYLGVESKKQTRQ